MCLSGCSLVKLLAIRVSKALPASPQNKAITATARKLLITIWHVWSKQQVDCHVDTQALARYFMTWSGFHPLARSNQLTWLEFVQQKLALLGISEKVRSFQYGGRNYQLHVPD
jgi:hypothetical protein